MTDENLRAYREIISASLGEVALTHEQMSSWISAYSLQELTDAQAAAILTALAVRRESASEIVSAARWLLNASVPLDRSPEPCLDTCGTGGDGRSTLNISTASALVAAACGARVVKHGNRAVSGSTGSADVLEHLGIPIDSTPAKAAASLVRNRFAFCLAPNYHPAMARFGPLRRQLGFRTIFNRLGPLLNPARAEYQLVGVGRADWLDGTAESLRLLGTQRSAVVWSESGADEIDLSGPCHYRIVEPDRITEGIWEPADFGANPIDAEALTVRSAEESAALIREAFAGRAEVARRVIAANAGAALWLYGLDPELPFCAAVADTAMRDGRAAKLLRALST